MFNVNRKYIPTFFLIAGSLPLAAAYFSQFFMGLQPCDLCLLQRWPYWLVVAAATVMFFVKSKLRILGILAVVCAALFFSGAGIAAYHSAIELKWIEGSSACSASSSAGKSIEELRAEIMNAPLVRCDEVSFRFLGLSMANWNVFLSLALGIASAVLFLRLNKGFYNER